MQNKILIVLALMASVTNTDAQDRNSKVAEKAINEVVVTGTGTFRRESNSPIAVKVITAKELKDAQVTSLQEALAKLTPNVTTHTSGMGTFVNFNGVSDDYILILENGKKVVGDDRWSRISIANIKRIEVLQGAASALYGSDAIAGVINIITDDSKDAVDVSNRTHVSSKGRVSEDITLDFNVGKFSSQTSYNYQTADNWQVNNNVKIVVNYQYNNNDRYANGKNKLFVGHDAGGNPTKDYTKVVEGKNKAGVDYHMIGLRFEIDF